MTSQFESDVHRQAYPDADQLEYTLRVLFHVVKSYQEWRLTPGGVPNELTDDAVRIGEEHLRLMNWWPKESI